MLSEFLDCSVLSTCLVQAVQHYQLRAPAVADYCDELFQRLENPDTILLSELLYVQRLQYLNGWLPPALAQNRLYKLLSSLGRDVTGMADH
jgi:hypothetical protein